MRATMSTKSRWCDNGVVGLGLYSLSSSSNLPRRLSPQQLSLTTTLFGVGEVKRTYFHSISEASTSFNSGRTLHSVAAASTSGNYSAWDDTPFEVLPNGKRAYLDEQDVVTFLDPPKQLIPFDPSSYNPASYLWKKIEDITEERRKRLVSLLQPRLITRAWEIAGTRYDDSKSVKKSVSPLLSGGDHADSPEFWNCRTSGGPLLISWINSFKKGVFICKDGKTYGRLIGIVTKKHQFVNILGGSLMSGIQNSLYPLYFAVRQQNEVMPTEQPCDFAYEFGDGLWDLPDSPQGFPKPAKHPWPINDQVVIYVRHVGPGVMVGQAWQEGEALHQVPRKLCGEILMVKDYLV